MGSHWLKAALLVLFLAAVVWVGHLLGINYSELTPEKVKAYILSFGIWAPALYLLFYSQPVIPLPATLMTMAGGLAFGPWWGTLGGICGATLRACGQFAIARLLGREAVAKMIHGRVARFDERLGENSFFSVWLVRSIPNVPYDMQNYAFGFSKVRFVPYAFGTLVGILPGSFALAYFGHSLTDPANIWKMVLAIVLIVCATFGVRQFLASRKAKVPEVKIENESVEAK